MGRGVGYGGGQSSLGYLFGDGGGETQPPPPPPVQKPSEDISTEPSQNPLETSDNNNAIETDKPSSESSYNVINQNPKAAAHDSMTNNYHRVDGQNCGNYITNRLSTKVHAPPGGRSSLGYMFGGDKK